MTNERTSFGTTGEGAAPRRWSGGKAKRSFLDGCWWLGLAAVALCGRAWAGELPAPEWAHLAGSGADVASSAYLYRADRPSDANPPEAWLLLAQAADLPFDQPIATNAAGVSEVLCGLLWEEVRPIRRVDLVWPAGSARWPAPGELRLRCFNSQDQTAHTWWNPRSVIEAGPPRVSADGGMYSYEVPVDTWGVVVVMPGQSGAEHAVPELRAFIADTWKEMEVEVEWGYEAARAASTYDGSLAAYDGRIGGLAPLSGAAGTTVTAPTEWRSPAASVAGSGREAPRRGVRFRLLYLGESRWRRTWPYHAQREDVVRTIVTVRTVSGSFSFLAADLEHGPILAPEYGFFVRAVRVPQEAPADRPPPRELLAGKATAIPGVPLMRGWSTGEIPWLGVNPTTETGQSGSLRIPARCVAMHPLPDRDVAVGWCSPIEGRVRVRARVAMGDSQGGNGIEWTLVRDSAERRRVLAQGAIPAGGTQIIPAEGAEAVEASVQRGDLVSLVVGAKAGDHACDTTIVELSLVETSGDRRTWDLTREVVDSIHAGNPHADAAGNPAVWHFYSASALAPVPAQPPLAQASTAGRATEFLTELAAKHLSTIRQRTREHAEPTWEEAVAAMRGTDLPPHPRPPFGPAMQVEVPSERLTAQWNLGAWHLLRHCAKDADGTLRFNDYPFGILASETYMILRTLDLQGMHAEAAGGLDQWLRLPLEPRSGPGTHEWSKPDRPLGHFSDGRGCLTHAVGPDGAGGHMDAVHCMGPGAIMFALAEHFRLTGDVAQLKAAAPRMQANVEWILRQRRLLANNVPGGDRLWSRGLQPAHVVTPDSERMHQQFYESEAYYWLAVKAMAELLAKVDAPEGARLAAAAAAYRRDLLASIDQSITLTPVVAVRDGTYHSFIPFAPYVRGFASGAWGWRRCQGHVGALYWDTVQSADPLVSPAGLLDPADPRVQGHLDVLEDRLLLENEKVTVRTPGFAPERDWFAHASWQYQCGLERHANLHLLASDVPNFLRSWLNQYAVDIVPGEYTFREHTTGGPLDKLFEEACFLERFRMLLVMEDGDRLWLARGTPRAWLEPGKRIAVKNAPTHFGTVAYEILSAVDQGRINATIELPARTPPQEVLLQLRHPTSAPITGVRVNGAEWKGFDALNGVVRLGELRGMARVEVTYGR